MTKNRIFAIENTKLLFAVCLFYVISSSAQTTRLYKHFSDSVNSGKQNISTLNKNLKKLSRHAENDAIRCIDIEGCEKFLTTILENRPDGSVVLLLTLDPCKTIDQHKKGGLEITLPDGTKVNRTGDATLDDYLTQLTFDNNNRLNDKYNKVVCNSAPQSSAKSSQKTPCNGDKNAKDASLIYECQMVRIAKTFNPTTIYKTCVVANPPQTTNSSLNMSGGVFVPSSMTTNIYYVGASSANATVSVVFDAQSNPNDIVIRDAAGNLIASATSVTGISPYKFCVPANTTFTITVSPTGTDVSTKDAWALSVSVTTTSNVTTPDGGASDPCPPPNPPCPTD